MLFKEKLARRRKIREKTLKIKRWKKKNKRKKVQEAATPDKILKISSISGQKTIRCLLRIGGYLKDSFCKALVLFLKC